MKTNLCKVSEDLLIKLRIERINGAKPLSSLVLEYEIDPSRTLDAATKMAGKKWWLMLQRYDKNIIFLI